MNLNDLCFFMLGLWNKKSLNILVSDEKNKLKVLETVQSKLNYFSMIS